MIQLHLGDRDAVRMSAPKFEAPPASRPAVLFRLNLYPERDQRRRLFRTALGRTVVLAVLAGLGVLFLIALAVSGVVLGERAGSLRALASSSSASLQGLRTPRPDDEALKRVLAVRLSRTDWAPVLQAVSDGIGEGLVVTEIASGNGATRALVLSGLVRPGFDGMTVTARFVEALRQDRRISDLFPLVRLDALETDRFRIVCAAPARPAAPPAEEKP